MCVHQIGPLRFRIALSRSTQVRIIKKEKKIRINRLILNMITQYHTVLVKGEDSSLYEKNALSIKWATKIAQTIMFVALRHYFADIILFCTSTASSSILNKAGKRIASSKYWYRQIQWAR